MTFIKPNTQTPKWAGRRARRPTTPITYFAAEPLLLHEWMKSSLMTFLLARGLQTSGQGGGVREERYREEEPFL